MCQDRYSWAREELNTLPALPFLPSRGLNHLLKYLAWIQFQHDCAAVNSNEQAARIKVGIYYSA